VRQQVRESRQKKGPFKQFEEQLIANAFLGVSTRCGLWKSPGHRERPELLSSPRRRLVRQVAYDGTVFVCRAAERPFTLRQVVSQRVLKFLKLL
jgi:hypothetical protein